MVLYRYTPSYSDRNSYYVFYYYYVVSIHYYLLFMNQQRNCARVCVCLKYVLVYIYLRYDHASKCNKVQIQLRILKISLTSFYSHSYCSCILPSKSRRRQSVCQPVGIYCSVYCGNCINSCVRFASKTEKVLAACAVVAVRDTRTRTNIARRRLFECNNNAIMIIII